MRTEWKSILIAGLLATSLTSFSADPTPPVSDAAKPPETKKEEKKTEEKTTEKKPVVPKDGISQGEFARILATRLGLFPSLTTSPTPQESAAALSAQGISPFDGWKLDLPLSKADFARMMIQAMGKAGEIPEADQNKPKAWTDLAAKLGIVLEHAVEGVGAADPLVTPFNASVEPAFGSSDPLVRREIFGQPDEDVSGTDAGFQRSFAPVSVEVVVPAVQQVRPSGARPAPPPPPPPTTRG